MLSGTLGRCYEHTLSRQRGRALLLAFASGGRRRSEIAALRVEDLAEDVLVPSDPAKPEGEKLRCYSIELGRAKTTDTQDRA